MTTDFSGWKKGYALNYKLKGQAQAHAQAQAQAHQVIIYYFTK
tara:strand:- start:129 stop:257 length:129 start_codon:yes stop_codon:yes gene_type:complete